MLDIFIQGYLFRKLIQAAVDPDTHIAASRSALQYLFMAPFPSPYYGCKQLYPRPLRHPHYLVNHLVNALFFNLTSAVRAVRRTYPCIEQTEIIIDFRHCSNC